MANYAFIDSQNLNLGVRKSGWRLDFRKFRVLLKDQYKVELAFLFIGYISGNEKLYKYLQESGYILIFKPTLEYKKKDKTVTKGNVDAELVLHTMIEWNHYDKALIISGDGDFYCLIEHLEQHDKLLKIIAPNHRYSSLLKKYAGYIVNISQFRKKVENEKRGIPAVRKPLVVPSS